RRGDYKHVILGLIFLKYGSDPSRSTTLSWSGKPRKTPASIPRTPTRHARERLLPPTARWAYLRDNARSPEIGKKIDGAMRAIEDSDRSGRLRGSCPATTSPAPGQDPPRPGDACRADARLTRGR